MSSFHEAQIIIDHLMIIENRSQDEKIKHLEQVVKVLWHTVSRLAAQHDQIALKAGDASIVLKKNGDIDIKGNNIMLQGSGRVNVRAAMDLTLKGARVLEN